MVEGPKIKHLVSPVLWYPLIILPVVAGKVLGTCLLDEMMMSCSSVVSNSATLWTAAYQDPQSIGVSRQEYWSGLPFPSS